MQALVIVVFITCEMAQASHVYRTVHAYGLVTRQARLVKFDLALEADGRAWS